MSSAALLLLADGRTPTGGHAHSNGLEAAVMEGLRAGGVPAFLAGRLEGVARAEASLAVAAARAGRAHNIAALEMLDEEARARCVVPALRDASSRLGRQLLRTARTIWPASPVLAAYAEASEHTPRCVAHGVVSAACGVDDVGCALALLHEEAGTVTTAAVRLLPVDPAVAARWIAEAGPAMEALAAEAAGGPTTRQGHTHEGGRPPFGDPIDLPAGFAPLHDLRAARHGATEGRLFAT